jgi:hypothetical protein
VTIERLDECYAVYGCGGWEGCNVVQDQLQNVGLCMYSRWEPVPPDWRFYFETNLKPSEALSLLGGYAERYNVRIQ